jgi:crotonobetainyl-CoA:carnitine CoA-transferase CaiB-like acyl-CoA transferase
VVDASDRLGWLAGRLLADFGAEVIKIEAPAAEIESAEWRALNVNKRVLRIDLAAGLEGAEFDALLRGADILIAPPAHQAALDCARLAERHPRLIVVAVTPFGLHGPKAGWLASDIEIMAAGGAMSLAGEPGGTPLRVSAPQACGWAGAQAAAGALVALAARARSGRGDLVDVSAQAAVITALAHAPVFYDMLGTVPTRAGAFITGRSVKGARFRVFWACRDGFLNFILYGGAAGRRTNEQLVAWMRERGADLAALAGVDWSRFDPTGSTQDEIDALEAPIARFLATLTKREFLDGAHRREMLGYPVSTVADIAADPQLQAREFWQTATAPDGSLERHCGSFVIVDGRRPPLLGTPQRLEPAAAGPWATPERSPGPALPGGAEGAGSARREAAPVGALVQALGGLRVVEFGGYAAGPHIGKLLANFGATVVHVETRARPDGFRLQYPPYRNGKPHVDGSGCFALFNDSKYDVTLDLKKPAGLALARQLTDWCDVVIENMRPGVMDRLGLGYAALSQSNAGLVMLSTCNMGQTGPRADTPGFGSQLTALAGMCGLTGQPDGPPMLLYGPYIDFIASTMGSAALLAALERRRRTGRGALLDVSQYECGLMFLAGALLDYRKNGKVAARAGNDDPQAAPHGAYRCGDGQWLVLSCWSDAEFSRLARAIGRPQWADSASFSGLPGRKRGAGELAAAIAAWTAERPASEAAALLQAAQIHAHGVATMADLFSDPQLLARRQWRRRRHPVIGDQAYLFPAFDLAAMPGEITAPAPRLGADNEAVFRGFLDLSAEQFDAARADGAID